MLDLFHPRRRGEEQRSSRSGAEADGGLATSGQVETAWKRVKSSFHRRRPAWAMDGRPRQGGGRRPGTARRVFVRGAASEPDGSGLPDRHDPVLASRPVRQLRRGIGAPVHSVLPGDLRDSVHLPARPGLCGRTVHLVHAPDGGFGHRLRAGASWNRAAGGEPHPTAIARPYPQGRIHPPARWPIEETRMNQTAPHRDFTEATSQFFTLREGETELRLHYNDCNPGEAAEAVVMLHGSGPGATGWANFNCNIVPLTARLSGDLARLSGLGAERQHRQRRLPLRAERADAEGAGRSPRPRSGACDRQFDGRAQRGGLRARLARAGRRSILMGGGTGGVSLSCRCRPRDQADRRALPRSDDREPGAG